MLNPPQPTLKVPSGTQKTFRFVDASSHLFKRVSVGPFVGQFALLKRSDNDLPVCLSVCVCVCVRVCVSACLCLCGVKVNSTHKCGAERAFSAAGLFFNKRRTRLDAKTIDVMCFLRQYFSRKFKLSVLVVMAVSLIELSVYTLVSIHAS